MKKEKIKKVLEKVKERKEHINFINVICSENEKLKRDILSSLREI